MSLFYVPGTFSKCCFFVISPQGCLLSPFKGGDCFLLSSWLFLSWACWFLNFEGLSLLVVRIPEISPVWKSWVLWGFVFPLWTPQCKKLFLLPSPSPRQSSSPLSPQAHLYSSCLSLCLLLSTFSCRGSVCESSGLLLGYFCWCACCVVVSMGWGKVSVLLTHHLPQDHIPHPVLTLLLKISWS